MKTKTTGKVSPVRIATNKKTNKLNTGEVVEKEALMLVGMGMSTANTDTYGGSSQTPQGRTT